MKLFKKKPKQEEKDDKDSVESIQNKGYKIVILEKLGGGAREVRKPFYAKRVIDPDDNVVLLVNKKLEFTEVFPEDIKLPKDYTKEEVKAKLKKLRKDLKDEVERDTEEVNEKNIEYDILKFEAIERALNFSTNSSYIKYDSEGVPTFEFLRHGSTMTPIKLDLDTSCSYTPSDNKKKSVIIALRNKENKYSKSDLLTGAMVFWVIVMLILTGANIWGAVANFNAYDESHLAELERQGLETLNYCSEVLAESTQKTYNNINSLINRTLETQSEIQAPPN